MHVCRIHQLPRYRQQEREFMNMRSQLIMENAVRVLVKAAGSRDASMFSYTVNIIGKNEPLLLA